MMREGEMPRAVMVMDEERRIFLLFPFLSLVLVLGLDLDLGLGGNPEKEGKAWMRERRWGN